MTNQNDFVIDNGTGFAVRQDIQDALQALAGNNSGDSEPSVKYAYQWWADTNANILKIRNGANNNWIELFQLDGTLILEDGSNSAPAIAFRDDLDTGIFSGGANEFNIATAGLERFVINSSGNVGIGTTSPDSLFTIDGSSNPTVSIKAGGTKRATLTADTGSSKTVLSSYDGFPLEFSSSAGGGNNTVMTLLNTGNVGIGTTVVDSNKLAVLSGVDGIGLYRDFTGNSTGGLYLNFGRKNSSGSLFKTAQIAGFGNDNTGTNGELAFNTLKSGALTEKLRIDSDGRVGIGDTTPASILEVRKSDNRAWDYNTVHSAVANYTAEDHELMIYNPDTTVGSYSGLFLAVASTGLNTARIAAIKRNLGQTDLGFAVRQGGTGYLFKERLRILSSGGITFNGDTGTNNALDDYEKGGFTPSITYETSDDGNKAYSTQAGSYTKIGRAVHCNIVIVLSNRGTGSGRIRLNNLPHDVGDTLSGTILEASGTVGYFDGLISSVSDIKPVATQGTNQLVFYGVLGTHAATTGNFTYSHIGNSFSIRFSITYFT